jgi:uncharacterized glyoxalase superfamily protein PhnB
MRGGPADTRATVIPALRYRDAAAAVEWLCKAFGFEKHLVVPSDDGNVVHAQLVFGNGMVMLGAGQQHGPFDEAVKPPADAGGVASQGPYIVVADADAHYERAVAAGAELVLELENADYGGRGYTCRDPEGHVWSFGTFDPWAE